MASFRILLNLRVKQGSIFVSWYMSAASLRLKNQNLSSHSDASSLVFQRRDLNKIKKQLTKDFFIWDWFFDNKFSIHFIQEKTSILFASKWM